MHVSIWFEIFDGLSQCQNPWHMGGERDNKEYPKIIIVIDFEVIQ